jgi:hypothetical protein
VNQLYCRYQKEVVFSNHQSPLKKRVRENVTPRHGCEPSNNLCGSLEQVSGESSSAMSSIDKVVTPKPFGNGGNDCANPAAAAGFNEDVHPTGIMYSYAIVTVKKTFFNINTVSAGTFAQHNLLYACRLDCTTSFLLEKL